MAITRNKSFTDNAPLLYLVATPIGNLEEFSNRAKKILSESDYIASEDTRNTKKLISIFDINKPLISLHEHNEKEASQKVISLLLEGKKVSYVSDAGYPAISDPGQKLVEEAIKNGINVSVVSGSNAMLNALVASGFDTSHFYFYGFLDARKPQREKEIEELSSRKETIIFYESPHRIMDTLKSLYLKLGNRRIVIARELTKIHEEFIRGYLKEVIQLDEKSLIGEMVLVIEGNQIIEEISDDIIFAKVHELMKNNPDLSKKDISKRISEELKISKNRVYDLLIKR